MFNLSIDANKDAVERFNKNRRAYHSASIHYINVTLELFNLGTCMAHNIVSDITFPSGLVLIDDIPYYEDFPTIDELEPNPIFLAARRAGVTDLKYKQGGRSIRPKRRRNADAETNIKKKGHRSITLSTDMILHTQGVTATYDFILVPLVVGEHRVAVSTICQELAEPELTEHIVTVDSIKL